YRRLPGRALHRREVRLERELGALIVEDTVLGRGEASVEARYHLGEAEVTLAAESGLDWLDALGPGAAWTAAGMLADGAALVWRDGRAWAALVPLGDTPVARLERGWWSPRYGARRPSTVVRFATHGPLPVVVRVAMLSLRHGSRGQSR